MCDMHYNKVSWVFPGDSDNKEPACIAGDSALIPGLRRSPGEGNGYSLPVFLSGEFCGQRSLAGYHPWGRKDSDTTERLHCSLSSQDSRVCSYFPVRGLQRVSLGADHSSSPRVTLEEPWVLLRQVGQGRCLSDKLAAGWSTWSIRLLTH